MKYNFKFGQYTATWQDIIYTFSFVHTVCLYVFFCFYVLYVECLIGGVPRMGPQVPFALLPLGIFIQ